MVKGPEQFPSGGAEEQPQGGKEKKRAKGESPEILELEDEVFPQAQPASKDSEELLERLNESLSDEEREPRPEAEPYAEERSTAEALEERSREMDEAAGIRHVAPRAESGEREPGALHERVEEALKSLGMEAGDAERIEGFADLSPGRQMLVLENLKQLAYGRIAEEAPDAFSKEMKESGILRGIWKTATKRFQLARIEKQQANAYLSGGFEAYQPLLEETKLAKMAHNGPEAKLTENGIELNYLPVEATSTPEEKEAIEAFNQAASVFRSIPDDWRFSTASPEQRAQYTEAWEKYEDARGAVLSFKKEQLFGRAAALEMNLIDANVHAEQGLNTSPGLEDQLHRIADESHWKRALRGILPEKEEGLTRGGFFALGYATRTAAASSLGLVGASVAAGVFGGIRGFKRGREEMREQQVAARKGKKTMVGEERDMKGVGALREKLENLSLRFDEAKTEEERARLAESLKARVLYTREKLDEDLIDFGGASSRYLEQYGLLQAIAFAQARATEATAPANRGIRARFEELIRPKIEAREEAAEQKKRRYAVEKGIRNGVYSAAFAGAGWMLAEYFSQTAGEKTGSSATEVLERMGSKDVTQQDVDTLWTENKIPGPAPDVEDIREAVAYQGGSSVWSESLNQIKARFAEQFPNLTEADRLYNIDRLKDAIVAHPEQYGLPSDVVWSEMTREQIANINWEGAAKDVFGDAGLTTDIEQLGEVPAGKAEAVEPPPTPAEKEPVPASTPGAGRWLSEGSPFAPLEERAPTTEELRALHDTYLPYKIIREEELEPGIVVRDIAQDTPSDKGLRFDWVLWDTENDQPIEMLPKDITFQTDAESAAREYLERQREVFDAHKTFVVDRLAEAQAHGLSGENREAVARFVEEKLAKHGIKPEHWWKGDLVRFWADYPNLPEDELDTIFRLNEASGNTFSPEALKRLYENGIIQNFSREGLSEQTLLSLLRIYESPDTAAPAVARVIGEEWRETGLFDAIEWVSDKDGDIKISFDVKDNAVDVDLIFYRDGTMAVDGHGFQNWHKNEPVPVTNEHIKEAMQFIQTRAEGGAIAEFPEETYR